MRLLRSAGVAALLLLAGTSAAQEKRPPRTVVLGFDGASADRVERLMQEGRLPNLAALAKRGGYSRLASSNPAQSPVAWASIVTGWNPGKTGIFDFLRRVPPKTPDGDAVGIDIGLAEARAEAPLAVWLRAALVFGAGAVGAAAGVGVVLALWAGERRKRRPKGALTLTMTGLATVFAAAAYVVLAWIPTTVPFAHNLRSGEPFWVTGDKQKVRWTVLEAPLSFPADKMTCGCCLSGLGVPDCQGTWGTYSLWTDDPDTPTDLETGGKTYFVEPGAKSFDLVLVGPRNPRADPGSVDAARNAALRERYKREAALDWVPARRKRSETDEELLRLADRATTKVAVAVAPGKAVSLTTAEGVKVDLPPGKWSDLVPVVFTISRLAKIHARARFHLESAGAAPTATGEPWTAFRLFVAPVQFDASQTLPPNVRLASPPSFAGELARVAGPFETIGWPELTGPVKDDAVSDRAFLDHLAIVRAGREKRLMDRLARDDWDCLFAMFSEPDRVQHALYRHVDEKSPTHDPKAAAEFAPEIDRAYVEMDRQVGEVVAAVGPQTRVLVLSDHGFAPFRRGVNLNNFLVSQGFQVRRADVGAMNLGAIGGSAGLEAVDWSETQAYAIGLGNLYLNLAGREAKGIVSKADADRTLERIERALLALRDKDGTQPVRRVFRGKDLYHGARAGEAPDLVVGFDWGYRVSWQTCLGALDRDVIIDNTLRWSGDHCSVDPELVPGILFSSEPLDPTAKPSVVDVAPSVLSLYGLVGPDPDGRSFLR